MLTQVPEYLQKVYIDDVADYVLPPFKSMTECARCTLTTHNIECGNAWTMAIFALILFRLLKSDLNHVKKIWPLILMSVAYLVHTPFSFVYHTLRAYSLQVACALQKWDVIMIFMSQFFVHVSMSCGIPWTISIITIACFGVITFHIISNINALGPLENSETFGTKMIPIVMLHIVPVVLSRNTHASKIGVLNILWAATIGAVYKYKIPQRFTKSMRFGIAQEYMHIGLWVNIMLQRNIIKCLMSSSSA